MLHRGLELLSPRTVETVGVGTATLNTNGSITTSNLSQLILNGIFTHEHDNYLVTWTGIASLQQVINIQFRSGGTTNTTANSYRYMGIQASSTTITRTPGAATSGLAFSADNTHMCGGIMYLFAPFLPQMTTWICKSASSVSGSSINDWSGLHTVESQFDGIVFISGGDNMTGTFSVYGFRRH